MLLAATGALLVFPDWLDESSTQNTFAPDQDERLLTPSAVVAAMNAALPKNDPAQRIVFPEIDGQVVRATTKQGRKIALQPYSGAVLSLKEKSDFDFHRLVLDLHISLLAGKVGTQITGISAICLCALCASGIFLWWPVGRWNRHYFLVVWQKGARRLNFDLHRNIGFYASIVLLPIGLTGVAMAYHAQVRPLVYALTGSSPVADEPKKIPAYERALMITPDDAVKAAQSHVPQTRLYRLYPPLNNDLPYRVFLNPESSFTSRHNESRLVIDSYTGAVLLENTPAKRSRGDAALMWVLPLHFGTFGGLATQCIYLVATLTPLLLTVTGLIIWFNRYRVRHRQRNATFSVDPSL